MSWNDVEKTTSADSKEKIPYTKFDAGNTTIRVIDNEPYSFWSHWLNKQQTSITCPGKDCPICAVIAEQRANKDMEKKYTSSQRHALRIWNYQTNRMEILIQGKTFFNQLLTFHREVGDITTYDIKVIRKGNGTDTTYTIVPQAPKMFEHTDKLVDVDYKELFSSPERDVIIKLMEGKTWEDIYPKDSDEQ